MMIVIETKHSNSSVFKEPIFSSWKVLKGGGGRGMEKLKREDEEQTRDQRFWAELSEVGGWFTMFWFQLEFLVFCPKIRW